MIVIKMLDGTTIYRTSIYMLSSKQGLIKLKNWKGNYKRVELNTESMTWEEHHIDYRYYKSVSEARSMTETVIAETLQAHQYVDELLKGV